MQNESIEHPGSTINKALRSNSSSEDFDKQQLLKSRMTLVLVFTCFFAPVALAYLALSTGWYNNIGSTNNGLLITPPASMEGLGIETQTEASETLSLWQLMYILPTDCNQTCENRLIQLRQTLTALGPNKHRVKALLVLQEEPASSRVSQWLETNERIHTTQTITPVFRDGLAEIQQTLVKSDLNSTNNLGPNSNHLYLVDPQGNVILVYPASASTQAEWLASGKAILKDLKRLLKVSRIG